MCIRDRLLSVHFKGPGLGEGSCFGVCWSAPMNAIEGSMNLCDDFYCIDAVSYTHLLL